MTSGLKKPLWRRAFLRALRGTGNVRVAAEAAGVDHSTAYLARKRDKDFAGAWAVAVAEGRVRVASGEAAPARVPGPLHHASHGPPPRPGEDLVVRVSKNAGAQLVKAGHGRWSARAEGVFVRSLERTGCVTAAAGACGFSTTALYNRKRNDAAFAERWRAAEMVARERLPGLLTAAAIAGLDPEIEDESLPPVDVDQAIRICARWGGGGSGSAPAFVPPPIEEVRARILARLDAIEAHEAREGAASD